MYLPFIYIFRFFFNTFFKKQKLSDSDYKGGETQPQKKTKVDIAYTGININFN